MKTKIVIFIIAMAQICTGQESFLDFNTAKELSVAESKSIIMVFSGSDWCKPCIQFKNEILGSVEFQNEKNGWILLYLDFPYKKQNALSKEELTHNETLAEIYNADGKFPKILLLNGQGEQVQEIEFSKAMTPHSFMEELKHSKIK